MDKYPLLRDQVKKVVVQHGRKGEAKSKDQVLMYIIYSGVFFYIIRVTREREMHRAVVVGNIFKSDVYWYVSIQGSQWNAIFFLNLGLGGVSSVNFFWEWKTRENSF